MSGMVGFEPSRHDSSRWVGTHRLGRSTWGGLREGWDVVVSRQESKGGGESDWA